MIETKYGFAVSDKIYNDNITHLTDQIWKMIPMWENEEDWQRQLNTTVLIKVAGLNEVFNSDQRFLDLLITLEGIKAMANEIDFFTFRSKVFESISLLQSLKK